MSRLLINVPLRGMYGMISCHLAWYHGTIDGGRMNTHVDTCGRVVIPKPVRIH